MSRQPPYNNSTDDQFNSEIEAIENAMNSMMQGAFSMMFKQFMGPNNNIMGDIFSGAFGNDETTTTTTTTTTVLDGQNLDTILFEKVNNNNDMYGGSDFKRLANKSKQNRTEEISKDEQTVLLKDDMLPIKRIRQLSSNEEDVNTNRVNTIFDLLFQTPSTLFSRLPSSFSNSNENDKESNWSYSSTSTRTIYKPDGTEETIITKKSNGITETTRQIRYPNGHKEEETKTEQKGSLWNKFSAYKFW
ncbi:uncharacterized protein BX663DRAFT_523972 [Cokeromyces recurvatus]|uniref:uncharacterized protein n=1 Tax=Cokeromyces recurvatus TaxID=90255 RepID=UPI0022212254|nr:uncharacterized protein BX663DRAFT_523972 [Cokeromyces recurvatus]KAI7898747.1 hypothetical protein BX663DRAFT_523972 [Cokeromyces recurvatus]